MTILDQLADHARERVEQAKRTVPLETVKQQALSLTEISDTTNVSNDIFVNKKDHKQLVRDKFSFERALQKPGISFICECKKASPSKGLIAPDFPYLQIAKEYEAAGADCISVLTEPKWFLGSDSYLKEIADTVSIPCLRKDFTVDEYMIYEASLLGASAVLLICSILSEAQIKEYINICDTLGLSALVEAHDDKEIQMALNTGARIIGVNNRNLKDFSVDTENSRKLRELIPRDVLFVSESGVSTADDVKRLREIGVDAVLIGETLMRATDKKAKLNELRGN
ncbi:MAG: indole-3-glycerol phosphate synthase TrpC [Lachnospiraceae bacterium]|nr:indole-3-glycerol phosphate synthase TrpC [Lachnospiraceae bacterium]